MKNIIFLILLIVFFSCSRKNNAFVNREYHKLTTWNNTLYNGQVAFDEVQKNKIGASKNDYFQLLKVEYYSPFELSTEEISYENDDSGLNFRPNRNIQFGGADSKKTGYNKSIEKSLKSIANHSMQIRGKENNNMIGRAYLLLGKTLMYQGKYSEAIGAFRSIEKNLPNSKLVNQSKIYLAEAQTLSGNVDEAKDIFAKLTQTKLVSKSKKNQKLTKKDHALLAKKYAQLLINTKKYEEAITQLNNAYKYNKESVERGRFRYIQGQLYELLGEKNKAKESYALAYKEKPSSEMEVKSQLAMALLFDPKTENVKIAEKSLLQLSEKGLYESRKNEIYYAIAKIAEKADSIKLAEKYYLKSLREKESDTELRGYVYKSLAESYYKKSKYILSANYYDSAFAKISNPKLKDEMSSIKSNLDELSKRYYLIKKNDSIIRVYAMNDAERNSFFGNYITKLKAKEALEQKALEENNTVFETENKSVANFSNSFSNAGKFYFYNSSTKLSGQQEFRKIWGDRQLTDNWRNKQNNFKGITEENLLGQEDAKNPERFNVNYYVNKIPKSIGRIDTLKIERDTAELFLGIAYHNDFKDNKLAIETLEHLLQTPPKKEDVKVQTLYNLYNYNKGLNNSNSDIYKDKLVSEFPNSKFTEFILNPTVNTFTESSPEAIAFYKETYDMYKLERYAEVKNKAIEALEKFPKDKIIAKFSLLTAYCEGKLGNKEEFIAALKRVNLIFEGTEEAAKASEILNQIKTE